MSKKVGKSTKNSVKYHQRIEKVSTAGPVMQYPVKVYAKRQKSDKEMCHIDRVPPDPFFLACRAAGGSVFHLNDIPLGDGINDRDKAEVHMKGLLIRGHVVPDASMVRNHAVIIIVYDTKPRGALPAVTDILAADGAIAQNNQNGTRRFRIMRRMDISMVAGTESSFPVIDEYVDLKGALARYNQTAGTGAIGTMEEGALYCVTTGSFSSPNGSAFYPSFRLRYTD